jgi:hypothetical protein
VSRASAYLRFGPADGTPGTFNDFSSYTPREADCVDGCPAPGFDFLPAGFGADNSVQMVANTPYFVLVELQIDPEPTNLQLSASIDPKFSAAAEGGFFAYSLGVTDASTTPEPGALVLMLSGFAVLGGLRRCGRRQ